MFWCRFTLSKLHQLQDGWVKDEHCSWWFSSCKRTQHWAEHAQPTWIESTQASSRDGSDAAPGSSSTRLTQCCWHQLQVCRSSNEFLHARLDLTPNKQGSREAGTRQLWPLTKKEDISWNIFKNTTYIFQTPRQILATLVSTLSANSCYTNRNFSAIHIYACQQIIDLPFRNLGVDKSNEGGKNGAQFHLTLTDKNQSSSSQARSNALKSD